ncbi:hypothetical protein DEM34_16360 [Spiribacter halobius]|uniref:Uncharacterized protein n=1 Tax=Sediminicurvatus halobius TaxID=2182432 RepID=A0A2U2MX86_9GAMM|nr:hypothetical protein DEM34_16360 [Spiribacter halobius]
MRRISKQEKISGSEVVRRAIEAYDLDSGRDRDAEAALEVMVESIRVTRSELAALQKRLDETMSHAYRERVRKQVRDDVRAHLVTHPEELDALADYFGGQR